MAVGRTKKRAPAKAAKKPRVKAATEQTRETVTVTVLGIECVGKTRDVTRGKRNGCDVHVTLYPERVASWGATLPPRWQVFVSSGAITVAGYGAELAEAEADARAEILAECPRIAERLGLGRAA